MESDRLLTWMDLFCCDERMDIMKNEKVIIQAKAWILRHEIISSCIFALILGLVIGGAASVLDWRFA